MDGLSRHNQMDLTRAILRVDSDGRAIQCSDNQPGGKQCPSPHAGFGGHFTGGYPLTSLAGESENKSVPLSIKCDARAQCKMQRGAAVRLRPRGNAIPARGGVCVGLTESALRAHYHHQ